MNTSVSEMYRVARLLSMASAVFAGASITLFAIAPVAGYLAAITGYIFLFAAHIQLLRILTAITTWLKNMVEHAIRGSDTP